MPDDFHQVREKINVHDIKVNDHDSKLNLILKVSARQSSTDQPNDDSTEPQPNIGGDLGNLGELF